MILSKTSIFEEIMKKFIIFCSSLTIAALGILPTFANTNRMTHVPLLQGTYNMVLDRSKQTFNGRPVKTNLPIYQKETFTTYCDKIGCIAHSPNKRPPPRFFEYIWNNKQWESLTGQQHQYLICNNGSKVKSVKIDIIKPNGNGTFSGERTITVKKPGCPGEGPGQYRLTFTLTPNSILWGQ